MNNLHISLTDFRNESRVLKETKSLVSSGRVDYVYIAALMEEGSLEREQLDDKREVNRFGLSSRRLPKFLAAQLIKYIEFTFRLLFHYRKSNITIVNCHALASLPIGLLMKIFYGAKLVYDAHELETERNGLHGVRKKLSVILERFIIRYVDLTIVVGESIADYYQNMYAIDRPTVVMNSPEKKDISLQNIFRNKLKIFQESKIFLYQGNLSKGRSIEMLCAAFAAISDNTNVIIFMGYGELEEYVKSQAEKSANIYFHPAVPPDEVLDYTASADVGLCLIEPICKSYFLSLPNKLFEYLMAGLPLIVLNSYEQEKLVSDENLGIVIQDMSIEAIQKAIYSIASPSYYATNIERVRSIYNWEEQEKVMIAAYDKMLK